MASPLTLTPDEFKKRYGDITAPDSDVLLSLTPEEFNRRYNGKSAQQFEQPPAKPIRLAEKAFKSFGAASAGVIGEPAAAAIDILGGVDTAAEIRKRLSEVQAGVQREVPELGKEFKFEDLQDPSFYATKGVSVLPALIALVGTGAGAGGVGARGAAGLASRLGAGAKGLKAAKAIGEIGTSALISRTLEGALEASGTYNQLLNEGVDRDKAADAAAKVFRNNYALTGMDAAQHAAATLKLPPALSKGLVKWAANAVKLGVASGSEGLEELYQGYVAKSAQEYAKGMSSIDGLDAKEFWDYATRAPLWEQEEFVIGSLFGLGFQVGEGALAKYGKTEGELRQAVKRNPQEVIQTLKGQADEQRADNATREQVAQQAFGKKFDDLTDEQKQKIVDKSAEQKTAEEDARIDETLQGVTEQAEPLEEISQKVYGKPYAELPLAQRQALKKRYQTLAEKAQAKKVDEAIAEKVGLKKPKAEKPAKKVRSEEAQPPVAEAAATASTAAERTAPAAEPVALKPEVVTPQAEISPSQKAVAPSPVSARAGEEPQPSKTAVVEKPIAEIETDVDRFQNRATEFSEKTAATVAERFDPNLFDPIVLWRDPQNGKEYVLSGHSRLEGMKRRGAKNIPSRYFQGTEAEAMNFAKVEANRLGSAENLQETIKAYKQAKRGNATKSKLKDLFDGDVDFLESAQNLNESGDFIRYLGQGAATEFPYIKRFSRWVGELRKTHGGKITDRHEQQIFDWLYKGEKRNREIEKDRFFELVDKQVSRTDFNPNAPLQLKRGEAPKIGTRGRADTAKLEDELDQLRADKKNARTPAEATAIDKEIARVETAIKTLVKTQPDLFGETEARPVPPASATPTHAEFDRAFETFQEVAAKQTGKPVPEQSAAIAEELRARNVNPVIIDELTNPRRALKPRDPESERSATSRPERIAHAAKPSPTLKPKVDAVAQANVDFRNKEAALLKAREEIKADIKARGGEVVVDTETGAMTITLRSGKAKISEADQALIEKLRAEAAEAGAYSLATVGQGFEISSTPERIADAPPLPAGDFKARALEFLKRNAEAKAAENVFKQAKEDARNDLVDYYLAERAAGKETPSALLGLAKDGTKVEVMARRVRSAAEPDLAVGGRDFPKEIAEAKKQAKERATETGEPFVETRKAGEKKVKQAKERGAFVAEQSEGYQPNRPGDFLFNPDAVFEQKPYEPNYKKRADATPRTDRLAKEAVEAIGHNRRRGRVYLANAINAEAREKGTVTLVGQTIRTSDDLAVLAQVYRDPRWETLRYVFVKGNEVVNVLGVSNRLPSASAAFPFASREEGLKWLNETMQKSGADGYYLLHNHPSGNSTPSKADFDITGVISDSVKGFKGHVVIDSNEYSVISRPDANNLTVRKVEKFFGEEKLLKPSIENPLIGFILSNPEKLAEIGKKIQTPKGWVTLISADTKNKVRAIMQIEEEVMSSSKGNRRGAIIRGFARQTGGASVFAVTSNEFFSKNQFSLRRAVNFGFLRDVVSDGGESVYDKAGITDKGLFFGKEIEAGRLVKEGETKKQPWEMTSQEMEEAINNAKPIKTETVETVVDWGSGRGQGKRSGGMIKGSMSDMNVRGKKTYRQMKLYDGDVSGSGKDRTRQQDFDTLSNYAADQYLKARAIGIDHDIALFYASDFDSYGETTNWHELIVKEAIERGEAVPDKVLSEYPELKNRVKEGAQEIPDTITVDDKERPTRNSKGQLIHGTRKGIENFWKWFGDSKVVDEQGRPIAMYHGTRSSFDVFDLEKSNKEALYGPGFYFTESPDVAGSTGGATTEEEIYTKAAFNLAGYAFQGRSFELEPLTKKQLSHIKRLFSGREVEREAREDIGMRRNWVNGFNALKAGEKEFSRWVANDAPMWFRERIKAERKQITSPQVYSVYLSAKNPFIMNKVLSQAQASETLAKLSKTFDAAVIAATQKTIDEDFRKGEQVTNNTIYQKLLYQAGYGGKKSFLNKDIEDSGYDSIQHEGGNIIGTHGKHGVTIVFNPAQIKSAIGNRGTFSPDEPSIVRESEGTYGKAGLNRDQFLDLGKMVNDFLQSKEQVAKLSKAEREEFALILDVLKEYKSLSEKADLSPSEKVLLKYAIRDIESPEGKRVIDKVQAALRENKPIEPSWLDKIAEWTAAMYLWRLASVGSSLGSNLFRQLLKYPELKLAAWFNQGVARQTRVERTRFSEEAERDFRDAWTGEEFKNAARKALDIMQEKSDAAEESKFFEREKIKRRAIPGKPGKIIRAGLNAQAAIDVLFRQPATTAAISRYAFREAAKTSKNRVEQAKKANAIAQNVRRLKALKDAKQEVPEYLEKFEPILAKAEADAEAQTFQSELEGFLKHVSEIRRYPLARIFVPFFNTRMNVLLQAYARTPFSAFGSEFRDLGAKYLNKSLTAEEAGRLSDRMAEITLGTAAFLVTTAALYGLSDDDEELITGDFDEKTIGEKPAGWLPNAVRVGDTFVSLKGFEPYATIFTAFGNAASGKKSIPRNAAEALAKAAFSNPMTDELFDIMGSLKDGDADKFFVDMVAGAATPGLLQDISKIADPTVRQKEGLEERFKSKVGIPGASTGLLPRIDVFGEELAPQTSGERALKAVTGVSISKSKEDAARREIRKLGLKHSLDAITHKGVELEPWEVLYLNQSIGKQYHETVLKLLQNPTYLAADNEARKDKLRSVRRKLIDDQKKILERSPYFMARERMASAQKKARERVKEQLAE